VETELQASFTLKIEWDFLQGEPPAPITNSDEKIIIMSFPGIEALPYNPQPGYHGSKYRHRRTYRLFRCTSFQM
jgi:hypothetical protein